MNRDDNRITVAAVPGLSPLPGIFPGVDHINYFNLRTDKAPGSNPDPLPRLVTHQRLRLKTQLLGQRLLGRHEATIGERSRKNDSDPATDAKIMRMKV